MVGRGRSCRVTSYILSQVFQPGEPFWLTPSRVKGTVLFLSIPWKAGKWFRMHSHVSVHMEMSGPHRAFAENRRLEMGMDSCLESGTGCNPGFEYAYFVENILKFCFGRKSDICSKVASLEESMFL